MYAQDTFEPDHTISPTGHIIEDMQLNGYRPAEGEADPRPTPEDQAIQTAVSDIFDALISTMADTSLDFDLDEILWSTVNTFHRAAERIERKLDDNEQAQKRLQREQDGSEVKSVQLESLIGIGGNLIERRESLELFRETAADIFLRVTGTHWAPRSGSRTNHRHLTAAMIDSRDFLAAKKIAETEMLVPPGPKVAFSGGDTTDHRTIWDRLDQIHAKHPDMVLMHGGSPKGAERIAATWASNRKVPQVAFKPDWTKHAKAAPFKRNDQMLDCLPIGVIIFPGTGIQENLADKAGKMGIPVYRMAKGGA
ncbi:DUF2493 domain-containing protein [Pseudogemmobacter humi]|uniref:YspA cpYpsA-related SLOG domain-containing protein n=1 Tax=Pseudogemmobacter humi TaxID=2483812 RepID=A0A3P5XQC7_9RHOB|nr:DUF2493 domain-containing protein [Pseudogemmobacter humi]VDC33883.1 hypothetical protein XINFAN_04112 [Pseudogemmobacter humi]